MTRRLGRVALLVAGGAVVIIYNTWIWWRRVDAHGVIFDGYLSAFAAADQPGHMFFRIGDFVSAILAAGVGLLALCRPPAVVRNSNWGTASLVALLLFAVATGLDAYCSMDCSPTLSRTCAVAERAGRLSARHYAHTYTSLGAQAGIMASMWTAAIAMARRRAARRIVCVVVAAAGIESVALVIMMALLASAAPKIGYPQAVMVATASAWVCLLAIGTAYPRAGHADRHVSWSAGGHAAADLVWSASGRGEYGEDDRSGRCVPGRNGSFRPVR